LLKSFGTGKGKPRDSILAAYHNKIPGRKTWKNKKQKEKKNEKKHLNCVDDFGYRLKHDFRFDSQSGDIWGLR
jgi:hypothetical protein